MASAWAKAPERTIDLRPETDIGTVLAHEIIEATFEPELNSDPALRAKVHSSSYGTVVPVQKPRPTKIELGLEEIPPFRPQLGNDDIRSKVNSTGYGKQVIYKKPPPEPEAFPFRPQTANSPIATALKQKANSSGYGKVVAEKSKPKVAVNQPSFKPDLSQGEKVRKRVQSSGYGRKVILSPAQQRPKTAPGLRRSSSLRENRVLRNTLLTDKPEKKERPPSPKFNLDGVRMAAESANRIRKGLHNTEPVISYEKPALTKQAQKVRENAQSSSYGSNWSPPVAEKKIAQQPAPGRLTFSKQDNALGKFVDTPQSSLRDLLKEKANSSGYGPEFQPPRGEKKEYEPGARFAFGVEKKLGSEVPPPPPSTIREKIKEKVPSSGYGSTYEPVKKEREERFDVEHSWRNTYNGKQAIKPLEELGLPPKSPMHGQVATRYNDRPTSAPSNGSSYTTTTTTSYSTTSYSNGGAAAAAVEYEDEGEYIEEEQQVEGGDEDDDSFQREEELAQAEAAAEQEGAEDEEEFESY